MKLKPQQFQPGRTGEKASDRVQTPGNRSGNALNSVSGHPLQDKTNSAREELGCAGATRDRFSRISVDKGELRMRRSEYGPLQWSLVSTAPGIPAGFRRWNIILIAILAFLVLGVFVVAKAPHTGSGAPDAAKISLKDNEGNSSLQGTVSKNGRLTPVHGHGRAGNANNGVSSEHHTG